MNISIDASTATPSALRLTAAILTFIASFKENPQNISIPIPPFALPPEATLRPSVVASPAPPAPPAAISPASEDIGAQEPVADLGESQRYNADVNAGNEEPIFDAVGAAWNPELNTANQSKNTDGTWRRKRTSKGEAPAAPKTVELPKSPRVPPPPPLTSATVETVTTVPPAPSTPTASAVAVVAPVPPVPPVSTVSSSPLAELGGDTFAALVKYSTNLVGQKKIGVTAMLEACAECGVPDIHACSKPENAALIPLVAVAISKRVAK